MRELIFLTLANNLPRLKIFDQIRFAIYRLAGVKIKGKCLIWGPLMIRPIGAAKNIEIGGGTFINADVRFGVPGEHVIIGENVQIGPGVMFETFNHNLNYEKGVGRGGHTRAIVVEDEVWISAGAIITPGVNLGRGSVVAAGAVVTRDVKANTLVGGVPAKFIRDI